VGAAAPWAPRHVAPDDGRGVVQPAVHTRPVRERGGRGLPMGKPAQRISRGLWWLVTLSGTMPLSGYRVYLLVGHGPWIHANTG